MSDNPLAFADLALAPAVLTALKAVGYEQPSPVQAACIPLLLEGHDVLATAQTGTGKTAAFALPLLSQLDINQKLPQVLVLAPTRELAIQVAEAFQTYAQHIPGLSVLPVYGGQAMDTQLRQLRRGVHVVVGTPGRVMDHLRRKTLKLEQLKTVVLDEADEMLRMGFIDDVEWILEHTPSERQVALFSATMPKPIRKIADTYLNKPKTVSIEAKTRTVEAIEQVCWIVRGTNKLDALTRILDMETFDGIVIFVRTKTATVELADKLEQRGLRASPINGDMSQQLRERTIEKLKQGGIDILVATDVAARGIDVTRVSHVINYDMPYDTDVYVHRIGRTGRAGRSGKAILFVAQREQRLLRAIEKHTNQPIKQIDLPTREQVNKKRIDIFKNSIVKLLEEKPQKMFSDIVTDILQNQDVSPEHLAATLACLAQKHKPIIIPIEKTKKRKPNSDFGERSFGDRPSRRSRGDRSDRGDRPARKERAPKAVTDDQGNNVEMETFKLAVGHNQSVSPGDIVGAIANEIGISSQYIGRINLGDDSTMVDLPAGMPKSMFHHLKKVRVRNKALSIERTSATKDEGEANGNSAASDVYRSEPKTRRKPRTNSGNDRGDNKRNSKPSPRRGANSDSFRSSKRKPRDS